MQQSISSESTKDTTSISGHSYQPAPTVYSSRRFSLRSLPCESPPFPSISPHSGRYVHSVRVVIRFPFSRSLLSASDQCIFWMFVMSPIHSKRALVPGPTVRGRIPARPVSPFEDGYELNDRYCGYKARGAYAPFNLELSLPGEYTVTAWLGDRSLTRTYHVTPLFP